MFILLRVLDIYGDPVGYDPSYTGIMDTMSFLNTTKYPASLQYLLMTLGPALMLLGLLDKTSAKRESLLKTLGGTSLFYYICHLYLIHLLTFAGNRCNEIFGPSN